MLDMIEFLKTPDTNFTDHFERANFKLTWNVTVTLAVFLFLISCFFMVVEPKFAIHYGVGTIFTAISCYWLFVKRQYKGVAKALTICSYALVNTSLFLIPNAPHYTEPYWIFIITLFAYFTLGKKWGAIFLFGNFVSTGLYFVFYINQNLTGIKHIPFQQSIGMTLEFGLCSLIVGFIINQFISSKKWAELELKTANEKITTEKNIVDKHVKEKTVLLQEIHHRVKNNLQVIISLLRMQSGNLDSIETKEHFNGAINRIMTMALVHQKMYEKDNLEEINLREYLISLVDDLNSSTSSEHKIKYELQSNIDKLGIKSIVPLALIITELVTNSIKHAFTESNQDPKIEIVISEVDKNSGFFTLTYCDNGKWKSKVGSSFGTELIDTLTEQLEGNFDLVKSDAGTTYSFSLKSVDQL